MANVSHCGRYRVQEVTDATALAEVLALRHLCFRARGPGVELPGGLDADAFDDSSRHFALYDVASDRAVGSFRLALHATGAEAAQGYVGQCYDLASWADMRGPIGELGRFCIHPDHGDTDLLRTAWGALAGEVQRHRIRWLIGCASFQGTDVTMHQAGFAALARRHLGPDHLRPAALVPGAVAVKAEVPPKPKDVPPLLRSYLGMGAWVSDRAVVDHDLGTTHVFTALRIAAVPAARARALLALVP